ncbi:MAG: hypothetical protein AB7N71_09970 [Phycisphaerae bacterium]
MSQRLRAGLFAPVLFGFFMMSATGGCTSAPRLAPVISSDQSINRKIDERTRHILIILDSIPFEIVEELHANGRFPAFQKPSRVISPFPVMTDPCLTEFFGISPCPAVESAYFDGNKLTNAKKVYEAGTNTPWLRFCDYSLPSSEHWFSYLAPNTGYRNELADIQKALGVSSKRDFVAYVVGTSAVGSARGRTGHVEALVQLDRFCRQIMAEAQGKLQITLMSDHGHNLVANQRISLIRSLERCGYTVGKTLTHDSDLVVPEWGLVSCVALYAKSPAVARDVASFEGVDLVMYEERENAVIVLKRDAEARVIKRGDEFVYEMLRGDPLGFASFAGGGISVSMTDDEWWERTKNSDYPDVVRRIWRAFNGLLINEPTVLVSLEDGYYAGSEAIESLMKMTSVHGNLRRQGSAGFVMTTLGDLPDVVRISQVAAELRGLTQIPIIGAESAQKP